MNTVELYNPKAKRIVYKKAWPSKWDEMTTRQFLRVAPVLFSQSDKYKAASRVVYIFLDAPLKAVKIQYGDLFNLYEYVNFVFEENAFTVKQFIPRTWLGLVPFLGLKDNFSDMTAGQFATAEAIFQAAIQHPNNKELLGRLAACVYRPFWSKKFDDSLIIGRGKRFSRKPIGWLYSVMFNYILIRTSFTVQYPTMFNMYEDKAADKKKSRNFGFIGVLQKLPGDLFGTFEQRASEPIHNVLLHLEMSAIEAKEM